MRASPTGMTSTYYKAFAPRIGIAYSPNFTSGPLAALFGSNGKTSIRAGWGLFYNPIEEFVLAQFGAEPPFGGSSSLADVFFNTPFVNQGEFTSPNPLTASSLPTKGQPVGPVAVSAYSSLRRIPAAFALAVHRQYNLTIQRDLGNDMMLQIGYVGSQGHRLLACHDINPSNPQTCLDIISIANANPGNVSTYGSPGTCGPTVEDSQWSVTVPYGFPFHMPNGSVVNRYWPDSQSRRLRPYSSPNCNPTAAGLLPAWLSGGWSSRFHRYLRRRHHRQLLLQRAGGDVQKRFSHGLQFQAAYTLSKSMDDGFNLRRNAQSV